MFRVPPAHLQRGQTALVDRGGDHRGPPRHRRSAQAAPFAYITGDYEMDSQHEVVISQFEVVAGGLLAPMSPATVAAGAEPFMLAVSPDGESVYVANSSTADSVSQYDVGAGGELSPKSPAEGGRRRLPVVGGGEPGRRERLRHRRERRPEPRPALSRSSTSVPGGALSPKSPARVAAGVWSVRRGGEPGWRKRLRHRTSFPPATGLHFNTSRRGRGALAQEPGHGELRHRHRRGRGQPRRQKRLRHQPLRRSPASCAPTPQQFLPVRRRRWRGALAQEPGHGRGRRRPVRGGGEPGRSERLRHQRHRRGYVSQYDVGAGGGSRPRARPRSPPAAARAAWR